MMDFLYHQGLRDVFVISGGGNIHLVDSLKRSKLNYVCNHHEQACATAMEEKIKYALSYKGPILCNINTVRNLRLTPRVQTEKRPE